MTPCLPEGAWTDTGATLAVVHGAAAAVLAGERVALNFVQRLSGIATLTRRAADAVQGTSARITHTRKTTPGLRALEVYAVRTGGGVENRASLAAGGAARGPGRRGAPPRSGPGAASPAMPGARMPGRVRHCSPWPRSRTRRPPRRSAATSTPRAETVTGD